jgi:hypothetical protein
MVTRSTNFTVNEIITLPWEPEFSTENVPRGKRNGVRRQAFTLYGLRAQNIQEKLYESSIENDMKQVNAFLSIA